MAPNQPQFDLKASNPKMVRDVEEREVYFKNDEMNTSMTSTGTYGQKNQNFNLGGIGPQGYLNLRDNVKTVLVT